MKNGKLIRILSFFLLLSVILSLFGVFAMAEGEDINEDVNENDALGVIYNRTFDEGWDYNNGMKTASQGNHVFKIDSNKLSATKYNHYFSVRSGDENDGYVYIEADEYSESTGRVYFEIDVRAASGTDVGPAVTAITRGGDAAEYNYLVSFFEGEMYLLGERVESVNTEWRTVGFVFDFSYDAEGYKYEITAYTADASVSRVYDSFSGELGIAKIRIGIGRDTTVGQGYDLDNIRLYYGTNTFTDISDMGCGFLVNEEMAKSFPLKGYFEESKSATISGAPSLPRIDYTNGIRDGLSVYYNRHYSEGWDYINGTDEKYNRYRDFIYELRYDYDSSINRGTSLYNYYMHFGCTKYGSGANYNGFLSVRLAEHAIDSGKLYIEFDINACEGINTNGAFYLVCKPNKLMGKDSGDGAYIVKFLDGHLYMFDEDMGPVGEDWVHMAFEFDFDYAQNPENNAESPYHFKITGYCGSEGKTASKIMIGGDIGGKPTFGFDALRIGFHGQKSNSVGHYFGIDNLQIYGGCDGFATLPNDEYGLLFNYDKPKDFAIAGGVKNYSTEEIYDMSLTMKLKVNYAYVDGKRMPIYEAEDGTVYGAPVKQDGKIYLPLVALIDFTGASYNLRGNTVEIYCGGTTSIISFGESVANVGGKRVALNSAPGFITQGKNSYAVIDILDVENIFRGFYIVYDDMGLITVTEHEGFISRNMDGGLDAMVNVMRKFIYEFPGEDEIYELAKENTLNFDHPYIIADARTFQNLRRRYAAKPTDEDFDATYVAYVDSLVGEVNDYLSNLKSELTGNLFVSFDKDGYYAGLVEEPVNPYPESGGYDPLGGRLNIFFERYTVKLKETALLAQITHDCDVDERGYCDGDCHSYAHSLAKFAYDWCVALCEWDHWCEDHILHCAEATYDVALTYDWLYNMWVSMGLDPEPIEEGIFRNGVEAGWRSVNGYTCKYPRWNGHAHIYHTMENNWNNVGVNGMNVGAFAIMGNDAYKSYATNLVAVNVMAHGTNSLALYAPDGAYSESAGYWDAATAQTYVFIAVLESCIGKDCGYGDTWGFDKTCYFGCQVESSDFVTWNYHDGTNTAVNSGFFFLASIVQEDPILYDIRQAQIENGKAPSLWDVMYYQFGRTGERVELPLTYHMEGLDAFVVRSSWDKGAMYAGIMGGDNGATHANIDSGNFTYHIDGTIIFCDLGKGQYNAYNYFSNYNLYKRGGEGQNIVIIAGQEDLLPYGQKQNATGSMYKTYTDEHGSYALIDNTAAYGGLASKAQRGMLVTNDNKTVVIQDEITFTTMMEAYWFGHVDLKQIKSIKVDEDLGGRVAYITAPDRVNGGEITVRVTLVANRRDIRFDVWSCYKFVLNGTFRPGQSIASGGTAEEDDRSYFNKLVIVGNEKNPDNRYLSFEVAVVIEKIDKDNPVECGYVYTPMVDWAPSADNRALPEKEETVTVRKRLPNPNTVRQGAITIAGLTDPFGKDYDAMFEALCGVVYTRKLISDERIINQGAEFEEALYAALDYLDSYERHYRNLYLAAESAEWIVMDLLGIK